jgi:hypothetical protein
MVTKVSFSKSFQLGLPTRPQPAPISTITWHQGQSDLGFSENGGYQDTDTFKTTRFIVFCLENEPYWGFSGSLVSVFVSDISLFHSFLRPIGCQGCSGQDLVAPRPQGWSISISKIYLSGSCFLMFSSSSNVHEKACLSNPEPSWCWFVKKTGHTPNTMVHDGSWLFYASGKHILNSKIKKQDTPQTI